VSFRIYEDEDAMSGVVGRMLAAAGIDCLTSNQAGNGGFSDQAQLEFATARRRVLVTHNMKDFLRLHGEWATVGRDHAGIIIITAQRTAPSVLVAKLTQLLEERTEQDMVNAILFVGPMPSDR
jgi:hypothetical protein